MNKCSNVLTKESGMFFLVHQVVHLKLTLSRTMSNQRSVSGTLSVSCSFASDAKAESIKQCTFLLWEGILRPTYVLFEASKVLGGRWSPSNGCSACGPSNTMVTTDHRQFCILCGKKRHNGECQASVTFWDWNLSFDLKWVLSLLRKLVSESAVQTPDIGRELVPPVQCQNR